MMCIEITSCIIILYNTIYSKYSLYIFFIYQFLKLARAICKRLIQTLCNLIREIETSYQHDAEFVGTVTRTIHQNTIIIRYICKSKHTHTRSELRLRAN